MCDQLIDPANNGSLVISNSETSDGKVTLDCPLPNSNAFASAASTLLLISSLPPRVFKCQRLDCDKQFTSIACYKQHLRTHNNHMQCNISGCNTLCKSDKQLHQHYKEKHKMKLVDGEWISLQDRRRATGKKHLCTHPGCGRQYPSPYKLKQHMVTHTGERPHICQVEGCDAKFTSKMLLQRHLLIHNEDKSYFCQFEGCTKSFNRLDNLKQHMRSHSGTKMYSCAVAGCERGFTTLTSLKVHLQRHTGYRPHSCTYSGCDKTYLTISNLKAHLRSHEEQKKRTKCKFSTAKQLLSNIHTNTNTHSYALPETFSPQSFMNVPMDMPEKESKSVSSSIVPTALSDDMTVHNPDDNVTPIVHESDTSGHDEDTAKLISSSTTDRLNSSLITDVSKPDFMDILTGGLDMNDITTAALGEVACVQYITSNLKDSLALLTDSDVTSTYQGTETFHENAMDTDSVNDSLHQNISFSSEVNNIHNNMISGHDYEITDFSPITARKIKSRNNCTVFSANKRIMFSSESNRATLDSTNQLYDPETSMELSTGHLEIGYGMHSSSALPDHIYLNQNIVHSMTESEPYENSTVNIEDIR